MNINLTLISQAITFGVFIWFTVKFVWPPLVAAIEARQKHIAEGLAAADEGKKSLSVAQDRVGVIESEARARALETVALNERRGAQIVAEAEAKAKVEAERIIARAKADALNEITRAKEALRDRVADLAVNGAEKILRREVDAKAHADMLNQLKAEL